MRVKRTSLPKPALAWERLRKHRTPRAIWRALGMRRARRGYAGARLLRAFADAYPEAVFVEIGANDGQAHDHLAPFIRAREWTGVMVEPVPFLYERLLRNYGDLNGRVALEHAAVADRDGRLPFYAPRERDAAGGDLPEWYPAIGSFSREAVLRHARHIPDIEDRVELIEVPCLTFKSLCRKHTIDRIDLLAVDVEGYDLEILRQLDLDAQRPRVVIYEHYHLGDAEQAEARARFKAAGYQTMEEYFDTFCLDARVDDGLARLWGELQPAVPGVSLARGG